MSLVRHDKIEEVYIGDKKGIEFLFLKEDGVTPRDLTGHAAWVTYAHEDAAPHIERQASIDAVNGLVKYEEQGDEYDAVGEVLVTATVVNPEMGVGTGVGYFSSSFELVRRLVRRVPG